MHRSRLLWTIVLAAAVAVPVGAQGRKGEPEPAEWVPAEAIFYVGITDTERFWGDFKKTSAYQAMMDKDVPVEKGAPDLRVIFEKFQQRIARILGTEADALKSPFTGPLAAYVTLPRGGGEKNLEPGLIASVGDAALMQKYFDAALRHFKEGAAEYEAVSAGSETIHVLTSKKGGGGAGGPSRGDDEDISPADWEAGLTKAMDKLFSPEDLPEKLAVCLTKDRLIVGASPEQVRRMLSREKGGDSLAGTDDYKALLEHLKPTGEVRMLLNVPRLIELAKAEAGKGDELAKWLGVLGAGSLRSVVGHLRVGTKSYDSKMEFLFLMSGERAGLAKLLSMENRPVAPPPTVPAATAIYASINLNPPRLLDEILRMVRQNDPGTADEVVQSMEKVPLNPQEEPVNLRKEVVDHLSGPLALGISFTRPLGAGSVRLLLSLGHRNRESLSRTLAKVPGMTSRDVRGTPVFTPMGAPVALAVTGEQVILGNPAALDSALAADTSAPLAEDSVFRRALRLVPKEAWGVVYVDAHKLMDAIIELAKKPGESGGDPIVSGLLMGIQMSGADFSDPTKARKILEYSSATIATMATTTEGVQVTIVGLRPKED